jgi:sulfite reductase (ferredoxin)
MAIEILPGVSEAAKKDIFELKQKIADYRADLIPEDKFKHFRLTRGVYGQRQLGVQMVRLKLPFGRITPTQLRRLADISEKFTNGNLHLTTRQNIQFHYIKVDDTPELWNLIEDVGVTAREACGNTVRNVTGSSMAGIDPNEPFDIAPYVQAVFEYFLRNPVCQDMGRKIKIAFSSSDNDSAFTYIHDFGFIPKIQDGKRGFRVLVGGGLGAQAFLAHTAYDFLPEDQIIPFIEAGLRVFDRYGERTRRHKARMKYLIKDLGMETFMQLVHEEYFALKSKTFIIDTTTIQHIAPLRPTNFPQGTIEDNNRYEKWLKTNVIEQKQKGYYAVGLKVSNGDIKAPQARVIAALAEQYASEDMRITMNQGLLLKYVLPEALPHVYNVLYSLGFALPGFATIADITTCPGTDTCNLGVTNSMTLAKILEDVIHDEYEHLIFDNKIDIKMSGCMNSCGQHMAANIGLHGSSIKVGDKVAPAMQVILGGGVSPEGIGAVGDKIVKLPTKRMPEALRILLNDFEQKSLEGEYFNDYYKRLGKSYFYSLLKPVADPSKYVDDDFYDYGSEIYFTPEVGVGECAGIMYDMVGVIIREAEQKLIDAKDSLSQNLLPEAIYHAYTGYIIAAKAILLSLDKECNTQIKILRDFDSTIADKPVVFGLESLEETALAINKHSPERPFADEYIAGFEDFLQKVISYRKKDNAKQVVESHYKA